MVIIINEMKSNRTLIIGLGALAWCFGMIALYYVSHKPLTIEFILVIGKAIWSLVVALGIGSLAGGIGNRLMANPTSSKLTNMSLQSCVGLGVLSLIILIFGSTIGYLRVLLLIGLPGMIFLFRKSIRGWLRHFTDLRQFWVDSSKFGRVIGGVIGILLLFNLLIALAPPVKFDSLVYHLLLPNAYLLEGRVAYFPWIVMTGMPQNAEMLYTLAIVWGGNTAATALGWLFGVLTLVGLMAYLQNKFNYLTAWVCAAVLLSGYTTTLVMAWGYVDWLVMLAGLCALVCMDEWRVNGNWRMLGWGGVFTGLAVGSKYTSFVLGIAGIAALSWHAWKEQRSWLRGIIWYGLPAVLASFAWFLKNLITTGNPLYPFLFPAGAVTPVRISVYQNLVPWGNWLDLFLLPIRATYLGHDGADGYMASIGPLLVGLGALFWLGWRGRALEQRKSLENAFVISLAGLLIWGVGNRLSGNLIQTRYYFSIFPAFVFLAAAGFDAVRQLIIPGVRLQRIFLALVLLVVSLNTIEVGRLVIRQGVFQYLSGTRSEEDYIADNLGWYQLAMQAVRELPEGKQTLMLFEGRSLYCYPRCAPDEILDRWKRELHEFKSAQAIRMHWKELGFTHILYYRSGAEFLVEAGDPHHTADDLAELQAFLKTLPAPIDFGAVYQLYSLE